MTQEECAKLNGLLVKKIDAAIKARDESTSPIMKGFFQAAIDMDFAVLQDNILAGVDKTPKPVICHVCLEPIEQTGTGIEIDGKWYPVHIECYHKYKGTEEEQPWTREKSRLVTVCDKCLTASCWHGLFMCDASRTAGVVDKTVAELDAMKTEHPSNYSIESIRKHTGQEPRYKK